MKTEQQTENSKIAVLNLNINVYIKHKWFTKTAIVRFNNIFKKTILSIRNKF